MRRLGLTNIEKVTRVFDKVSWKTSLDTMSILLDMPSSLLVDTVSLTLGGNPGQDNELVNRLTLGTTMVTMIHPKVRPND